MGNSWKKVTQNKREASYVFTGIQAFILEVQVFVEEPSWVERLLQVKSRRINARIDASTKKLR
jgi:hypothetical protein